MPTMRNRLFLLTRRDDSAALNYDFYDSIVVCAGTTVQAVKVRPDKATDSHAWPYPPYVECRLLGVAARSIPPNTVVCASFNAG